ncbi:unnamed protein product [Vitrella brassicaformis CCMP3155]|uniref:Group 1 truncated hemoglobin n=1 Tax=Vitrella brassicaformis (strain CCMP3155) TaxID=1169540 RepID=A0A0G4H7N6_VITBC|nr:unnamed protein product [Vitrella brassicaformis CCMP3155]|eukprot:CEM39929.1 unnamed protein product [Vitrella brassicaformis CCMP3155]
MAAPLFGLFFICSGAAFHLRQPSRVLFPSADQTVRQQRQLRLTRGVALQVSARGDQDVEESFKAGMTEPDNRSPAGDSLYVRIGGAAAVEAAVDRFYTKILADDRVKRFFSETDMKKQRSHMGKFLTFAFGGSSSYSERGMREAHKKPVSQGMDETHFDAVMENLAATLKDLGVPDDLIGEAAAIALSTKKDVLNQ